MTSTSASTTQTMNILSLIFFFVAGVWLIAALCYSLMVLCFLRLRSNGELGSIYDENYGRIRIYGTNWYIPMGCIFRRYARHLNLENDDPNLSRFMTRDERRNAMEILLLQQQQQSQRRKSNNNNNKKSNVTKENEDIETATSKEETEQSSSKEQPQQVISKTESNDDLESIDGPMCSICLGGYDENDENDDAPFQSNTCIHQFHESCILDWLQRQSNHACPCCRIDMVTEDQVWKTVKKQRKLKRKNKNKSNNKKKDQDQQHEDISETEQDLEFDEIDLEQQQPQQNQQNQQEQQS